jgi:CTP:molybdopterin cytidylyltransferase MocA
LLIRGIYGAPTGSISLSAAKLANGAKMWNYIRQLGGVTVSAIADNKNTVNRFGLGRSFSALLKSFSGDSAFRLNKADLRKWGAADELAGLTVNNRYLEQSDLSAYRSGKAMSLLNRTSNAFSKANLLNYYNDYNKRIVATLHGTDIIEACINDTLTKKDAEFLAQARIPFAVRKEIADRFRATGYFDENGLAVFRMDRWKDDDATRAFAASLAAASNQTIVVPSVGDTPRVFKKTWGKLLFQYKAYQFGLVNNIIAPWFNGQNSHAAATIVSGMGLGYLSQYIHSLLSGDPYKHLDDPEFRDAALDRSDLFGYMSDVASFTKRALNANTSFAKTAERLSPTGALLSDVWQVKNAVIKSLKDEEYRASERMLRIVKGLLPFNNLFYFNSLLNNYLRNKSEREDRKLLKTREDRYWEGE